MSNVDPARVLSFWLGELDESGRASAEASARWWKKSEDFDAEVRERFEATLRAISEDTCEGWLETPRGRLAYVVVLDQLSRNMFRGTGEMYAEDERALRVALAAIDGGDVARLGFHERYFLFMPLMHAEDVALQERCVELFESMKGDFPEHAADVDGAVGFATQHRDIVRRFGRFPHRNALLGRASTPEERAFLEGPGSSF